MLTVYEETEKIGHSDLHFGELNHAQSNRGVKGRYTKQVMIDGVPHYHEMFAGVTQI